MKTLFKRGAVVFLMLFLVTACRTKKAGPVSQDFIMVYTANVSGELEPCGCKARRLGGLAQRAYHVKELEKKGMPVMQVDAGNVFFRYDYSARKPDENQIKRAEVLARGMARMGVSAINVGSQDLAAGLSVLKDRLLKPEGEEPLPFISANLVDSQDKQLIFPAYQVVEVGKLKVGIFGVMRPARGKSPQVEILDPEAAALATVKELQDKVDFVIVLGDIGSDEMAKICREVTGINVAVVSKGRMTIQKPNFVNESLIVNSGRGGKYLGQMKISYDSGAVSEDMIKKRSLLKQELDRLTLQLQILQGAIQKDPELEAKASEVKQRKIEVEKELEEIPRGLDFENSLFPVDLSLPMDPVIADWVGNVLGRAPAGGSPSP
jgi:2',3'-cyclic-nucleotide 2'-phosphodiesterase (5'-nucleotidase family)